MLIFTLAIYCHFQFTLFHGHNIPESYAILFFIASDFTCITNINQQLGVAFALAPSLHSFWSYFSLFSSSILGSSWPEEFIFQCPISLPFHTVHGWKVWRIPRCSRQEYWSGLPFPSPVDHILSEPSTMTCPSWVALHGMAHSFIELDKVMAHVIRLVSFLCLWFSVCLPSDGAG